MLNPSAGYSTVIWSNYSEELIPTAYEATIAQTGIPATLEEWGGVVEKAIDTAYRLSQQQHHGIPWHQTEPMSKAYRGRCQPRTPQAIDIRSLTKMARPGDYNPTTEIYHFKTMRCIRQVRRVQSLQRRLRKTSTLIHMTDLQHEWAKICTDKSFGGCFVRWCQRHPDIGPLPRLLPSHDFLWTLEQVLRYETDRQIADDARVWRKKQEFFRQMDGHHKGYSQAFAQLRSRPFEPLQSLGISVEAEASMVPGQHFASMFLETDHGFQANHTATYHSHLCHVVSTSSDFITIRSEESTEEWPGEGTLTQQVLLTHPTHIMQALTDFWQPLWTRPTNEDDMISLRQLLSAIPDDLPAIRVDLDDEALWCSAVRELKSASGRGVDAISAAELQSLPDSCIRHLGKILASYSEGFPSWLMMARTIALPKRTGVIPPSQIRPITILAQTYRLWSKVVCKVILKHFAQTMPPEITGLLKHRGPMEAAYQAQVLHEIAMFQGACEGGFSLDLIKCFNTIGRPQALCLLRALGIPHAIIQVWHSSIEHLHRVWDIQGTYSEVLNCTNGVPEGDTFSVIVMLAVAYAWVCSVKAVAPHTRIGAYADNWGWATNRVCDHATILRATTQFVQAMGMSIDWLKSWYWATSRAHQQAIAQAIRCHTDVAVAKVAFAQDLGCTMTYHGPPNHQSATKRFQEGKKRLANLASMPHPFQVKCHLVKAGVIPVVMMGVEFVPIKPQAFSALRTAIANAILGQSVSRNSTMAVNCMPLLIDPELDTFMRSIRALKRYLARMMPQDDSVIFHLLAQHSGNPKDCRGPLGTLKCYLHRLGWSVLPGGLIAVSAFVSLPIRTTSMSDFTTWALRAWEADFAAAHSDRKTWQRLSPIDLTGTKQMVASFKSNQQAMLLNEISSAYQTAIQQKAWDPTIDGTCKHCGQPDTKHHRIFTCDALAEVRQSYSQLLSDLGEHDSVWHDLPVLFSQPEEEFIATLHYTQKPAMCSEDTLSQLNNLGHRVQCYTDGSCMFPASITTRFAAHAIIIDLCPDDDTRRFEAVRWLTTKQIPSTLMPLHLTRLPGRQVIHRAELYALVQVCENLHHAQVFSDSSYVITAFHRCQETLCVHHLEVHDNADLLIRLWYALQNGDHIVSKIKAHNDPAAERDSLQRYRMLGNQKANDMAIWANLHLHPAFVKELNAFHCAVRSNQDQLREFYKLQLELNCVRAKLEAAGQKDRPPQVVSTQHRLSALQQLQQWDIQEPWTWPTPSMDLSRESVWGPTMTSKLLQWLQQLRWPSNQNAPDEFGVTWLELACSFWMTVGCFIPVKRQDQRGVWRVIPIDSYATAMLHQVKFSEQAKMLSQWIDQVGDLIDTKIIPAYPRGLVRSLYTIGSGIQSSGVQVRPSFPWQEQVVTTLHLHFQNVKSQSMTVIPNFQLAPGVNFNGLEAEFRQSWDQRSKRVHDSARKIRSWRRCPQQQLRF